MSKQEKKQVTDTEMANQADLSYRFATIHELIHAAHKTCSQGTKTLCRRQYLTTK